MAANASRVSAILDTEASVTLRDIADGAETATAIETSISLAELDLAYWHNGEIPHGVFEVAVHITALDTTSDETYALELIVDDVSAMNDTPRVVAMIPVVSRNTGFYKVYVDSKTILNADTDTSGTDKFLAIRATLGGTTPSITYGAWISRQRRA